MRLVQGKRCLEEETKREVGCESVEECACGLHRSSPIASHINKKLNCNFLPAQGSNKVKTEKKGSVIEAACHWSTFLSQKNDRFVKEKKGKRKAGTRSKTHMQNEISFLALL